MCSNIWWKEYVWYNDKATWANLVYGEWKYVVRSLRLYTVQEYSFMLYIIITVIVIVIYR